MHTHTHSHGHGHHHHHGKQGSHPALKFAILLIISFAAIAAFGGWWAHSLALLSDAGHMASDALSLIIAAFAAWVSKKPPSLKHSYGLGRAEVVAAWVSSLIMLLVSLAVISEAVERIHQPQQVHGLTVLIIGSFGLIINSLVAWLLSKDERTLNIRAALLHVMSDVLGSVAALVAGAIIIKTGWFPIDPILSILIGILILISSLRLFRESLIVLMEGVPGHIDMEKVSKKMAALPGIKTIHDLHIWTLSSGITALSAHVHIFELSSWERVLSELQKMLKKEFAIEHVTLQPEPEIIDCHPCQNPEAQQ